MNTILPLLAVGIIVLVLSQFVIILLRSFLLIYLQARIDTQVMLNSFEHLLALPLSFFLRHASGDTLSRLASNTIIFDLLSNQLISTILDGSLVVTTQDSSPPSVVRKSFMLRAWQPQAAKPAA